jgi:glutathione S-transferase
VPTLRGSSDKVSIVFMARGVVLSGGSGAMKAQPGARRQRERRRRVAGFSFDRAREARRIARAREGHPMAAPIVFGPTFSTYVRTARLALEEKPAPYELVDVPLMQGAHKEEPFLKRNPFGKVPAFEHDGFALYETSAILRYVDRAVPGAKLQPADVKRLARMDQVIGIVDSFAYPSIIGKLVWQRIVTPMIGGTPDDAIVHEALPQIRLCLSELDRLLGEAQWFGGETVSLADLHLAPLLAYMTGTPEGGELLAAQRRLGAWWQRISARPSMAKTQPKFG